MAESNNYDRHWMAFKNLRYLYLDLYRKKVADSWCRILISTLRYQILKEILKKSKQIMKDMENNATERTVCSKGLLVSQKKRLREDKVIIKYLKNYPMEDQLD